MEKIEYTPIGIVHTPFKERKGTPIQPRAGKGIRGFIEIFDEYIEGLDGLEGFSHIVLVYHLHLSKGYKLRVVPYMDDNEKGVFATRAPRRPNPIGLSVVKLTGIKGNILEIEDIDIIDGTPLLDIKPFVPPFDTPEDVRIGWLKSRVHKLPETKDDGRFDL